MVREHSITSTITFTAILTLLIFILRLLAHSDEAEPAPEPSVGESAPALAADTPAQDTVAGASSQPVSTTETAKSMKCDVYVEMQR